MSTPSARVPRVLFVCHYNRQRSATAERIFCKDPDLEVRSAGTCREALVCVSQVMLEWADVIFIMDELQRRHLEADFPNHPALSRTICLNIPDRYKFLDPELVRLLRERTAPHLEKLKASGGRS